MKILHMIHNNGDNKKASCCNGFIVQNILDSQAFLFWLSPLLRIISKIFMFVCDYMICFLFSFNHFYDHFYAMPQTKQFHKIDDYNW